MDARGTPPQPWPPTKYHGYEDTIETNMAPAKVWTDAGPAYLKPMAADVNPHALAVELICTRLAAWFGLSVLDTCILTLGPSDTFPRKKPKSPGTPPADCLPGPALCTRSVVASRWDGTAKSLSQIANTADITRLIVFDTWVRNDDRYPPRDAAGAVQSQWRPNLGNVLLVRDPPTARQSKLVAMDFGRAIIGEGEIPTRDFGIAKDKDEWVYGLYPEFREHVTQPLVVAAGARLNELEIAVIEAFADEIPPEWGVGSAARAALVGHLYRRARYLADTIQARLVPLCDPQGRIPER